MEVTLVFLAPSWPFFDGSAFFDKIKAKQQQDTSQCFPSHTKNKLLLYTINKSVVSMQNFQQRQNVEQNFDIFLKFSLCIVLF